MDQEQLDKFRQALLSLQEEIEQLTKANEEAAQTVELDQSKVGRLSRMDAMQAQQMAQETARRRRIHKQKIDSALRRINSREYGYCLKCGDEINAGRLNFDPTSTRCTECMDD